jgi:membrane protease YdiL (CAAX protease family)
MNYSVFVFVAITYVLSIAFSLAVWLTGGHKSEFAGLGLIAMFFPAIAVLVVRFAMKEKVPSMGWSRFPLKYLPVALLLMPAMMHAMMLPLTSVLEGGLPWQDWLTPQADGLYYTPESRGWGTVTILGLVRRIAMNAGVGLIIVSVLAFFEEVGWRAWMLPRLVDRIGARRAVIAGAAIWAFWHTPFILSGIQHLDGVPAAQTALIMPIGHLGAGMVIGWLWLRTESIWMVALAHGALNNWGQYAFKFMQGFGEHDLLLLGAGNLALLALGSLLLARGFPSASRPSDSGSSWFKQPR